MVFDTQPWDDKEGEGYRFNPRAWTTRSPSTPAVKPGYMVHLPDSGHGSAGWDNRISCLRIVRCPEKKNNHAVHIRRVTTRILQKDPQSRPPHLHGGPNPSYGHGICWDPCLWGLEPGDPLPAWCCLSWCHWRPRRTGVHGANIPPGVLRSLASVGLGAGDAGPEGIQ